MKFNIFLSSIFCITILCFNACTTSKKNTISKRTTGAGEALLQEIEMTKDPALNAVPFQRILTAKMQRDAMPVTEAALTDVNWTNIGPKNQGGRTRTLLIDANDATGKTIFAGSVGGGLWKTTDINAANPNWIPVNDLLGNLAITSIAQDPTNPQIIYIGTGEGYYNQDAIEGLGVWKSTNGGSTFTQLAATNNFNFFYCQKVLVSSTGILYIATASGLLRSANGGTSFTKVLGLGLGIGGAVDNLCYDVEIAANGDVFSSLYGSIHKSTNNGVTFNAAPTLPINAGRIELAIAPNDANYCYAVVEYGGVSNGVLKTINGGLSWLAKANISTTNQSWYNLCIAVDPNNKEVLFAGDIDIYKSINGATNWTNVSNVYTTGYLHADQHNIVFKAGSSSELYITNDGGVYRCLNANTTTPTYFNKGNNYITTQFYAAAIHPTANKNHYLGGAQDNGTHLFTSNTISNTTKVLGADGAHCYIDQNQPIYQFGSQQNGEYYMSNNEGINFNYAINVSGSRFINPTDYDHVSNIMYTCGITNTYNRWNNPQTGNSVTIVTASAFGGQISTIKVSPNTANRVFFGIDNGSVIKVDNANALTPTFTNISTGLPNGYLNCIEVETGNDNHMLALYTNYGLNSIWETTNGGTSWVSVEGNLPDMPIRWALFNPSNNDQAIIATELGVWSTDNLNGASTIWGASNNGLANVKVSMLQLRQSDKLVVAATHGRGLFISDIFTSPTASFDADKKIAYMGSQINFNNTSYKGTSWTWNFGDGSTSGLKNPTHTYTLEGDYTVTLTINAGASTQSKTDYIKIMPNKGTPYLAANGGDFESNTGDFATDNIQGTNWELGNSAIVGKNGTKSGAVAWVTGLAADYIDKSESILYTSSYNFFTTGTYTLKFWAKFNIEVDYDGFRIEYTTNKGNTWLPLGTTTAANWYNFSNTNGDAVFPINEAFFNGNLANYNPYTRDVSFLASNPSVAFRFHFISDLYTTAPGVAIDDFEITAPSNVVLADNNLVFNATIKNDNVFLKWKTENEVNIIKYEIQKSNDGINFENTGTVNAKNININSYEFIDQLNLENLKETKSLFYKLKINEINNKITYSNIQKIEIAINNEVKIWPNPFDDYIRLETKSAIKKVELYTIEGRKVFETTQVNSDKILLKKEISSGTYIIKIYTEKGVISKKINKG